VVRDKHEVFWAVVHEKMKQLFGELQWNDEGKMTRVTRETRVEAVKKQAERKFAGAYEDACQRLG
jgi:hypothetical protein